MNFLPYAESMKLKEAGIEIDSEFCHVKYKSENKWYIIPKHDIKFIHADIYEAVPAPTATEMLGIIPESIYIKYRRKHLELFLDRRMFALSHKTLYVQNKNILSALSETLLWLKQERYV